MAGSLSKLDGRIDEPKEGISELGDGGSETIRVSLVGAMQADMSAAQDVGRHARGNDEPLKLWRSENGLKLTSSLRGSSN